MLDNIKVGNVYSYFDDGKVKPSRHDFVQISEIIPFDEAPITIRHLWEKEVSDCNWLYAPSTPYFIKGVLRRAQEEVYFVKTLEESWFSLGWWGGDLDGDGSLLERIEKYWPDLCNECSKELKELRK